MLQCTQNTSCLYFDKKGNIWERYMIYKSHIIYMLVEEDYITAEIRRTTKNKKIEINTATKHDDMFITSYDIKLKKQIKILMFH